MTELVVRFLAGDRRALSRLLSHVENRTETGSIAVRESFTRTGRAHIVGVTGPPGAGKSTITNALIRHFRDGGRTVAVLAVDPSSAITGGAALGDRIRMMENYDDPGVFIRSMATRGQMGGLALAVTGATHLLDAFGFDLVLIETVGVGQDEVDIAEAADTTILLQVPGLGDSIQTIKAGVLEIADILVVNKSDRPDARQLVRDLRNMLLIGDRPGREIPIVETVATEAGGIARLAAEIDRHHAFLVETLRRAERVERRLLREVALLARERFERWLAVQLESSITIEERRALVNRLVDPGTVAGDLVDQMLERRSGDPLPG
ncbi:MAG TPA: methylmalonyl Co-A mutase-associated GTPase MeaB [Thermomicrobiaceae bacterium]|nr:methylmalonyl Co-A mutase-associated GTPase MeaB [Thermomicrobiaceae bacterium]